ncbi:MAG TPA: RagB/SusD family nutrient uptake outer membrane protein, partial [Longimicrobium sp.]
MNWKRLGFLAVTATMVAACDSPLEVDPTSFIPFEEALDSPDEIAGAVNGMYDALQTDGAYNRNIIAYPDLYADNLDFTGTFTTDREVWLRNVRSTNGSIAEIWETAYDGISRANNVLAAVDSVDELTDEESQQYQGEAYFVRALNYHNLVRFFGGVPLVTQPTWEIRANSTDVARATQAQVYQAIVTDLTSALDLLGTVEEEAGIRPLVGRASVPAVEALLARVYLDMGQYENARTMASAVIATGEFTLVPEYANIFRIKNSSESIFEVQYTVNDPNSLSFWFYPSAGGGRLGFQPTE